MNKKELLILGWHQVYLSANAGGYVRLREFVKRVPKDVNFFLLDNHPTLYNQDISSKNLFIYDTPRMIKPLRKKFFLLWLLLETIFAGFVVYKTADNIIKSNKCKVIYVPIGEFPQLYIPGIFLKRKYPHIKLIVDILNFELPDKNPVMYFKRLRKSGISLFRSITTIIMFYIGYLITVLTINIADYIFTVSPELVNKVKKVYKKDSIDYTPSGVDRTLVVTSKAKKYHGVYVGRITIQKGIIDLIDVWTKVVEKKKDAVLGLVGYIDHSLQKELKKILDERNLEKNILFLGQVSDKEKYTILSKSEIFLHLARYEPLFPVIGILEGLASGLYTIMYDIMVVASQMRQLKGELSLAIVRNGDIDGVVDKVIQYLSLQEKDKKIVNNKAKKFVKKYDWDIIAAKEFNVIRSLAK